MKRFLLAASAAVALAAVASVASAQVVTGTINLTGSVAPKCAVTPGDGSTFGGTFALGELAEADGTLRADLEAAAPVAAAQATFTVHCSSANIAISVDANPMVNAAAAPAGYSNVLNYTATATFDRATAVDLAVDNVTTNAATATVMGDYLANASPNILVTAHNFTAAPNGGTSLLVAGAYNLGVIVVTLTPS